MDYSRIRLLMMKKRISERELARQIGTTSGGLNNTLKRETLTVEKLEKLALALEVSPLYFFQEEENILNDGQVKYKSCKNCYEKDGKIELLLQQLKDKEDLIKQLYKDLGRKSPGKDSKVA